MITRNDPKAHYWSTGIVLTWHPQARRNNDGTPTPGWSGKLDFLDDGWAGDDNPDAGMVSTEGTLHTRYTVTDGQERTALAAVIDALLADAGLLGIHFTGPDLRPYLYYRGDGGTPTIRRQTDGATSSPPKPNGSDGPRTSTRRSGRDHVQSSR